MECNWPDWWKSTSCETTKVMWLLVVKLWECMRKILYHFDLFGSHASREGLPKPKCGRCHTSQRPLPKAQMGHSCWFGLNWCKKATFCLVGSKFCFPGSLRPLATWILTRVTHKFTKSIMRSTEISLMSRQSMVSTEMPNPPNMSQSQGHTK